MEECFSVRRVCVCVQFTVGLSVYLHFSVCVSMYSTVCVCLSVHVSACLYDCVSLCAAGLNVRSSCPHLSRQWNSLLVN